MTPLGLMPHFDQGRQRSLVCCAGIALLLGAGCVNTPQKAISPVAVVSQPSADQSTAGNQAAASNSTTPIETKKKPFKSSALAKSFNDAVTRGDAAWGTGDADMAIYLYVQALSYRPRDVNTLSKLGVIEEKRGNLPLAARAFELAANASPSDARLTARLGLIYLALGEDDNARTWLRRSADTASPDWRVYDGLGVVEERRGHNAAALQDLQRAVALAPGAPAPLLHRAQAMFSSGDYVGAEAAVRAALSHGELAGGWRLLGQIQAKRHAYSESVNSLLQVLDAPTAYNTVAKSALDNGDNAIALRYFEKASILSPVYLPETQRNAALARERLDPTSH